MQNDRSARVPTPLNNTYKNRTELMSLPATPSFSLAEANTIVDIEVQANQLLDYINKLTSLADRACNTAILQTETVQLIEENRNAEITNLRNQLEQQSAQFREQQLAMVRLEEGSKAQITALEIQLRQAEIQRNEEKELRILRRKNVGLISRLDEAEEIAKQAETRIHEQLTPLNREVAELRLQLANRDKTIQTKNNMIKTIELDFRAKIVELEQRLRDSETTLHELQTTIKEKDALIQATAGKEAEIGKLIKRLSTECDKLNTELKKTPSVTDSKIWRQVIGRFQEESS